MPPKKNYSRGRPRGNNFGNHNSRPTPAQFAAQIKLEEVDVGITQFISNLPGFSGIIKARFSDFHVNEINNLGEVAKLTDTSVPKEFICDHFIETDSSDYPRELIPEEIWSEIPKLLDSKEKKTLEIDVTNRTKEERTSIHNAVKRAFGQAVVSNSKDCNGKTVIELKKFTTECRRDLSVKWPKGLGEYVYFLMYKEAMDTICATFKISGCMRMKSSLFTYAGIKDRRAKTTQWYCVRKVSPKTILEKTKCLRSLHIGNFMFKDHPLKLGQLKGNLFRIVLRNVTINDSLIEESMKSLQVNGFINYYGLQRFGYDKEVPTFSIGIKLLQGNWKEACELILKPKSSEDPNSEVAKAKLVYKNSKNSSLACKQFKKSHNKCIESKLLLGLAKNNSNDYVNALENIPRNVRLLYLHSLQSLIWNKLVSYRIKEFGMKPIVGDLVLLTENSLEKLIENVPCNDNSDAEETEGDNASVTYQDVKILTENDLQNYTIYDIVLPLPGFDVKYPENKVKTRYAEILTSYDLTLEMPKQKVKTYNLSGAYRRMLEKVDNLSWKTMNYSHPNDVLIISDYEELKGEEEPKDNPDGQYKALLIDFCLKSASYATMVLREILKMDTSTTAHAKLNNYHNVSVNKSSESQSDHVEFANTTSLLSDTAKYEEFKKQIFGEISEEEEVIKRKIDEVSEETGPNKKSKGSEESSQGNIQMEPALI